MLHQQRIIRAVGSYAARSCRKFYSSDSHASALVSCEWLAERLENADSDKHGPKRLAVLDSTWFLPNSDFHNRAKVSPHVAIQSAAVEFVPGTCLLTREYLHTYMTYIHTLHMMHECAPAWRKSTGTTSLRCNCTKPVTYPRLASSTWTRSVTLSLLRRVCLAECLLIVRNSLRTNERLNDFLCQ